MRTLLRRIVMMARSLCSDRRVPRAIRPMIVLGLLPWPGPVDEVVLVLALGSLMALRPGLVRQLWRESGRGPSDEDGR